jgi:adenosine deaminase
MNRMSLTDFIYAMPKVELHVHLEGAVQPETVLTLARQHHIELPANDVEGIRRWYAFTDFPHFVRIYLKISECIRTPEDIELIAREFLAGQARQNIRHTEFTYTPYTHYHFKGLDGGAQLAALNRARRWAETELGITSGIILDISRNVTPEEGLWTADLAISGMNDGVVALGLGGPEVGHPPEKHAVSFDRAAAAGLACILHAGETAGAESIWGAIRHGRTARIGHGIRCLDDSALVDYLRETQIPLEVSPSSNVRLGVVPHLGDHPLPRLLAEGLYVTLNSDDPPMFDTTLTDEYLRVAEAFSFDADALIGLALNGLRASRLPEGHKQRLEAEFVSEFERLKRTFSLVN